MKPTDKAICLDIDGNHLAVFMGYTGITFAQMFSDSRVARIALYNRNGLRKGLVYRPA
jgi:hypothetical protein